ncbi:MAG: hypothetical protein GY861_26505 [bacterium]|nr:hypothetical protein [bacterium]
MRKSLVGAREELKRVDHLIYVSLKYTRTVDVIKSIVQRLMSCIESAIDELLEFAKEKKKITDIPTNIGLKCDTIKQVFPEEKIVDLMTFYLSLRKINRAEYKKSCEFRRHVTMSAITENGVIDIDIDTIKEYYERTIAFVEFVEEFIYGKRPEE